MKPATSVESRSRAHHRWILGRYVQLVSVLQLFVYAIAVFARAPNPMLPSLDPRLLLDIAAEMMVSGPQAFPSAVSWLSALAMLCVGQAVVQSRSGLVLYVALEGAYAAVFITFAALVLAANLSPSHGLSPPELIVPFAVFSVASAVPLMAALPLGRAPDHGD